MFVQISYVLQENINLDKTKQNQMILKGKKMSSDEWIPKIDCCV